MQEELPNETLKRLSTDTLRVNCQPHAIIQRTHWECRSLKRVQIAHKQLKGTECIWLVITLLHKFIVCCMCVCACTRIHCDCNPHAMWKT